MTLTVNTISNQNNLYRQNKNNAIKAASMAGAVTGVACAVASVSKKRGIKLQPSLLKSKENLFKSLKLKEVKEADALKIASASIAGGFLGGSLFDSENINAKAKEGVVQLAGNYIVPTLFVGAGMKFNKSLNKNIKSSSISKAVQFFTGLASLAAGVLAGNKISREINKHVFNEDNYRKLNGSDWVLQADNVCLVTSVANQGTKAAKIASAIIPAINLIPGYIVGTKKEN